MKITLKKMSLVNFKGIRSLDIEFGNETEISGDNATGKTTVFDAFLWLFFGKDSTDRKDFEIKTLDKAGAPLHKIEHEVSALIDVDGREIELRRVFKEKWAKERGAMLAVLKGNETQYFLDGVPLLQSEYQVKINSLIDEGLFKLITNTLYFNGLKWQERRQVLMNIADDISATEIAAGNPEFERLLAEISISGKPIEEFKRTLSARKKKLKEELEAIPTRIDELNRSIPEELAWENIKRDISFKGLAIMDIDQSIIDNTGALKEKHDAQRAIQQEVYDLQREADALKNNLKAALEQADRNAKSGIDDLKSKISSKKSAFSLKTTELLTSDRKVEDYTKRRAELIAAWEKINGEQITVDDHAFNCPTCKRALDPADIDEKKAEMLKNFNKDKALKLETINKDGKNVKALIESYTVESARLKGELEAIQPELQLLDAELTGTEFKEPESINSRLDKELASDDDYSSLMEAISAKKAAIEEIPQVDNNELLARKRAITAELDELKKQLAIRDQIERNNIRIAELETQERDLAQRLADLESTEFTIQQFEKAQMTELEDRVNNKFGCVKFRLFDHLIDGTEVPCCDTLVNGVPFPDANNAAKINAGLDIINTLCGHHGVYAPVFIDNSEAVNEIIPVQSQLIRLVVSKDKKLKVKNSHRPEMAEA